MPQAPRIATTSGALADADGDLLLIGAFATDGGVEPALPDGNDALADHIARLPASGFKGKLGEVHVGPAPERVAAKAVAVLGLGKGSKLGASEVRRAAGSAGRKLFEFKSIVVGLPREAGGVALTGPTVEGLILGSYRFVDHKSDKRPSQIESLSFADGDVADAERGVLKAGAAVVARDLINEPASTLTPTVLAERAAEIAEANGLTCEIWGPAELEERGFGGVLGVSQGSEQEPRFIQLRYAPEGAVGKVALVGKGVTYDTGGYSLKPPTSMEQMKTDMSGAAAVIGAMSVLGRLDIKTEVLGFIPATENLVSGRAIKPGDVMRHYGGKTTEVMNTDAEGRLILADALAFASEEKPDAIVDVATLTGSMTVALGLRSTGVFCNDEGLAAELSSAGEAAGERTWPMPLWEDYKSELESEIADLKNVGSRYGGAITAAIFLQQFVGEGIPWAHFDIAGPARSESDRDELPKGGTGVATRTFIEWLEGRGA
jgi:leucyl aminopeptidase